MAGAQQASQPLHLAARWTREQGQLVSRRIARQAVWWRASYSRPVHARRANVTDSFGVGFLLVEQRRGVDSLVTAPPRPKRCAYRDCERRRHLVNACDFTASVICHPQHNCICVRAHRSSGPDVTTGVACLGFFKCDRYTTRWHAARALCHSARARTVIATHSPAGVSSLPAMSCLKASTARARLNCATVWVAHQLCTPVPMRTRTLPGTGHFTPLVQSLSSNVSKPNSAPRSIPTVQDSRTSDRRVWPAAVTFPKHCRQSSSGGIDAPSAAAKLIAHLCGNVQSYHRTHILRNR